MIHLPIIFFILALFIWLFFGNGIDKIRHPEEWQNKGTSGEQIVYLTLKNKYKIPEQNILRNLYIPTKNGKTSEIDLLIVVENGLFVFECKNYSGNIYGDATKKKWIQYLGKKKNLFYNPLLQNKGHVNALKMYLEEYGALPIIPIVVTTTNGVWHIKNLKSNDYLLGYNCHFKNVLRNTPQSKKMAKYANQIIKKLTQVSRPNDNTQTKHIEQVHSAKNIKY